MTSEIQVFNKDKIRLNILPDVLSGMINLSFQLNDSAAQDYAKDIHEDGKRVYVYGKFNISEDANNGSNLTIRPIMMGFPLKILFRSNADFSGKKVSIVRSSTKSVEQEYEISSETSCIELVPQGKQYYVMKIFNEMGREVHGILNSSSLHTKKSQLSESREKKENHELRTSNFSAEELVVSGNDIPQTNQFQTAEISTSFDTFDNRFSSYDVRSSDVSTTPVNHSEFESPVPKRKGDQGSGYQSQYQDRDRGIEELQRIEQEISVVERQQQQLSWKKQSAIDHLERIEAEYKKDYSLLEQELNDIKSRMEADASIIEHYKDHDLLSVETIFREVQLKLDEAEEQIGLFIQAKQNKTLEIEKKIKSNKKK